LTLCRGVADFEISGRRIAALVNGGLVFSFSGIPSIGSLDLEILSGGGGFAFDIPPQGIDINGSTTVSIPFEPPIEISLSGDVVVKPDEISGSGSATVFDFINIANGDFALKSSGMLEASGNLGLYIGNIISLDLASANLNVDLINQTLNFGRSQGANLLNGLIVIPGSLGAKLFFDNKNQTMTITAEDGLPLTPAGGGQEALSMGM